MCLRNLRKIALLVAVSTSLTSISANASDLEEFAAEAESVSEDCATESESVSADYEANDVRDITSIPIGHHGKPIDEYTDENGNNIVVYNQFKLIQKPGEKYCSVRFNENLTYISLDLDPYMTLDFWDVVGDVIMPDTVTTISGDAMGNFKVLGNFGKSARENKEIEKYPAKFHISNSLAEIPDNMCSGSYFTGTLRIPNSVKKIGSNPFEGAHYDTIIVPKTVESIKYDAFLQGPGVNIFDNKLGNEWSDVFFEGNFLDDYSPMMFGYAQVRVHYPKGAAGFDRIKNWFTSGKEKSFRLIPYEGTLEEAIAQNEEQKRKEAEMLKNGVYSDTVSVNGYDISFTTHCIYTGKKIKLDAITVSDPNGKVFTDKQVRIKYKNNKNAYRANKNEEYAKFMITGIKGDKEANKAIKAALKNAWIDFTILPRDLSNENLSLKRDKSYKVRKISYSLNGKKKKVPKKCGDMTVVIFGSARIIQENIPYLAIMQNR